MNAEPQLSLRAVSKRYGDSFLLQVDNLDVGMGEVLCLLGPTGAGKSTLLRLMAGLELPTAGEIRFDSVKLAGQPLPLEVQRQMNMVFQRPLLLTGTVRTNVEFGLRLRGMRDSSSKVTEILARLGLSSLALQAANTLSGGQAQLVALARALVVQPRVLFVDEPTANLDPAHVALVEDVLGDFHRRQGMSIVWATHNLFQARRMAHRIGLLLGGKLVEVASPESFFETPSDPRTTDFVQGKMVY